jgi:hypothetical protein
VNLCRRADSTAPAECATMAYRGPFSTDESIQLCAQARSTQPASCAIEAYRGPYTKEEAIRLCRHQNALLTRALKLANESSGLPLKTWQEK